MAISNLAPASQAVDFAALERRVTALVETADRWATERPVLLDAEMAGRCSDYIDQVNGELKVVEMERRIQKRPLEDAAKAVDLRFRPLAALLEKIKAMLGPRQTAWLQAEQQRLAAERQAAEQQARQAAQEAARLASEAEAAGTITAAVQADQAAAQAQEAAKAAAAIPERAAAKGDYGLKAKALRTTWHARIVDANVVPRVYWYDPVVIEALGRVLNAAVRAGERAIPGVAIYSTQSAA